MKPWIAVALAVAWCIVAAMGLEMGLRAEDGAAMVRQFQGGK